MVALTELTGREDYAEELDRQVCRRCVARVAGAPPCAPRGVGCGVEMHLEKLIAICHTVDSTLIDPYRDRLRTEICADCTNRVTDHCPCPLDYLLPLAVMAVETVDRRRKTLCDQLARKFRGVQETD
jgi:hypothetical protein